MSTETKLRTFTEVYRPRTFEGIIDVNGNVPRIKSIVRRKIKQNFLFVGPPGTGKTTTSWATAREFIKVNLSKASRMQGTKIDDFILYINASKTGIDGIRNQVEPAVTVSGIRVIILDEFDGISISAQHALRFIMEEAEQKISPKLFILTANYLKKITDPIISRCGGEAFLFPIIPLKLMQPELIRICQLEGMTEFKHTEGITTKEEKTQDIANFFNAVYQRVKGDMREALKFLHTCIYDIPEGGKLLDLNITIVDLTTNAFYMELDKILLDYNETNFKTFIDSVEELVYKKDGDTWDRSTFFEEAFLWLKNRHEKFSHKIVLKFASIIGKFEDRMTRGRTIQTQLCAMVAEMELMLIENTLEELI